MKKNLVLIIGNSGLTHKNDSTNNRMLKINEFLKVKKNIKLYYYQLRECKYQPEFINFINHKVNNSYFFSFIFLLRSRIEYDLIIAEGTRGAVIAYIYSIFRKTPFVWRQFGITLNDELKTIPNKIKFSVLLKKYFYRKIVKSKRCVAVICTEDGCANKTFFLDRLKIKPEKFYLVKNQRTPTKLSFNNSKNSSTFTIVSIGRINKWKKLHILLNSFKKFIDLFNFNEDEIKLKLLGLDSDLEYEKYLILKAEELDIKKHLIILKNLELQQINKHITESSVTVSLTAYNPIIESLQNGTPVITYDYGEVYDIFKNFEAVKIICGDIRKSTYLSEKEELLIENELCNALIDCYKKKDKLKFIGIQGRKQLEKEFPTLDQHAKTVSQIYLKFIKC